MLEITLARGTEGNCYKCGRKIKAGDFIVVKPTYHGRKAKETVHDSCSPTKTKRHGENVKKR